MPASTKYHRMPDGTTTRDELAYVTAWREVGDRLEAMFPGYAVYGYDPGVLLRPMERNRHDTFSLPIGAVRALLGLGNNPAKPVPQGDGGAGNDS